jgi:hypothetical protein
LFATKTRQHKGNAGNGTSIAFSLMQLYYNNQPAIQTNMIPMSSRRRGVIKFRIECSLFVNEKALYSITGMTKYYIKSASATMLGTRRQANGIVRLSILLYDNRFTAVCASTIKIPDGWTPTKLFLGLLLQEQCSTKHLISIFRFQDQAPSYNEMHLLYYHSDATELQEMIKSSPNYSFVTGGF